MPEELKRCPFCGGEAAVHPDFRGRGLWTVSCKTYLECYAIEDYYPSREQAIAEWNRRVSSLEPLRPCPFCGGKAKVYSVVNRMWKVSCEVVNCASLASDWKTPEKAIAAWNRRVITERELISAMEALQRRKAKNAESAQEFFGDTEPDNGAGGTADSVSSAGIPDTVRGSTASGVEGDSRDDERRTD